MQRPPAKTIGERYLTRWHVIPKNRLFNLYLHHVQADDPDTHLHDYGKAKVREGRKMGHVTRLER